MKQYFLTIVLTILAATSVSAQKLYVVSIGIAEYEST